MKEQIQEILNKIKATLESELPKYTQYLIYKDDLDTNPRQIHINFCDLMPCAKNIYTLEELKFILNKAEKEALKYNKAKVIVNRDSYNRIEIWYYETEQEVYDRLYKKYEYLITNVDKRKKDEYNTYLELKSKFEK